MYEEWKLLEWEQIWETFFRRVYSKKAAGSDRVSGRVLKLGAANYILCKVTTIANILIYYLFYSLFLFNSTPFFYCTIEGANSHTFHYDYTQYDYTVCDK